MSWLKSHREELLELANFPGLISDRSVIGHITRNRFKMQYFKILLLCPKAGPCSKI
jgi:hypothetical protein